MTKFTGNSLIQWGFKPGKWFGEAIDLANSLYDDGWNTKAIKDRIAELEPAPVVTQSPRTNTLPFSVFLEPENDVERANLDQCIMQMDENMRVPTVRKGTVMPDACPAGPAPVGSVIATENAIHPGWHSPDICCSMALTVFKRDMDLSLLLDTAFNITHFGPGGRRDTWRLPSVLGAQMDDNPFLQNRIKKHGDVAETNLGTQGDGNHFLFIGRLRSTGKPAIVTHHGSRGVGALLYKRGMAAAKRHTAIVAPRVPSKAAWIEADSEEGRAYWDALQLAREWTKYNHFMIHEKIQQVIGNAVTDRFWNEHNFVFRRADGLYYHAKGATPSYHGFSEDDDGRTLIPMNMSEPILVTKHRDREDALGFAPHGAGRNMSRTKYLNEVIAGRPVPDVLAEQTMGLDVRFYTGTPDLSELPAAYKSARQVIEAIERHELADVVDYVDPYGSIMAGEMKWNRTKK